MESKYSSGVFNVSRHLSFLELKELFHVIPSHFFFTFISLFSVYLKTLTAQIV